MGDLGLMLPSPGLLEEQVLTCCLDMEMEEPFHTYMGYTLEKKYQSLHANLLCNVIHSPQAGREVPMVVILNGSFLSSPSLRWIASAPLMGNFP